METRKREKAGATIPWTQERAEQVCDQLEHADEAVREQAVEDLAKVAEQRERLHLEAPTRVSSAFALPGTLPLLALRVSFEEADHLPRTKGNDTVVERLCKSLGHPSKDTLSSSAGVRVTALWCMRYVAAGELSDNRRASGIRACVARLGDSEFAVRQASVECLVDLEGQSVVGEICTGVLPMAQWVAQEGGLNALRALAAPGDVEVMQAVSKKLTHPNIWVRSAAVSVLHAMCPQGGGCPVSVIKALAHAAVHRDDEGRADPSVTEAAREVAAERRSRTRAHTLHLLGRLLGSRAGPLVNAASTRSLTVKLYGAVSLVPGGEGVKRPVVVRLGKENGLLAAGEGETAAAVLDAGGGCLLEVESGDGARGSMHVQEWGGERSVRMELVGGTGEPAAAVWLGIVGDKVQETEDGPGQGAEGGAMGAAGRPGEGAPRGAVDMGGHAVPDEHVDEVVQCARDCLEEASAASVDVRYECVRIIGLASARCSVESWEGCMRAMEQVCENQDEAITCRKQALRSLRLLIEAGVASGCQHLVSREEAAERLFVSMVGSREEYVAPFQLNAWLRGADTSMVNEDDVFGGDEYSLDAFREACLRHRWPVVQAMNDEAMLSSLDKALPVITSCIKEPQLQHDALLALDAASMVICRCPRLLETAFAALQSKAFQPLAASRLCIDIVSMRLDKQPAENAMTCRASLLGDEDSCSFSPQQLTRAGFPAQLALDRQHHGTVAVKMWQGEAAGENGDGDLLAEGILEVSEAHTRGCVPTGCGFVGPKIYQSVELTLRGQKVGSVVVCVQHALEHQDPAARQQSVLREPSSESEQQVLGAGSDHASGRSALLSTMTMLSGLLETQTLKVPNEDLAVGGEVYGELLREHGLPLSGADTRMYRPSQLSREDPGLEECVDPHSARQGLITMGSFAAALSQVGGGGLGRGQESVIVGAMQICVQVMKSQALCSGVTAAGLRCLGLLEQALPQGGVAALVMSRENDEEADESPEGSSTLQCSHSVISTVGASLDLHLQIALQLFANPTPLSSDGQDAMHMPTVVVPDDCPSLESAVTLCEYRASHLGSRNLRSRVRVTGGVYDVSVLQISGGMDIECDSGTVLEGTVVLGPGAPGTVRGACFKANGGACVVVEGGEWMIEDCSFVPKDAFEALCQIPQGYDATERIRYDARVLFREMDQEGRGVVDWRTIKQWLSKECSWSEPLLENFWYKDSGVSVAEFVDFVLEMSLPVGEMHREEEVKVIQKAAEIEKEDRERRIEISLEQGAAVQASDGVALFCSNGRATVSACSVRGGNEDETVRLGLEWGVVVSGMANVNMMDSEIRGVRRSATCLQGQGRLCMERTRISSSPHALRYSPPTCVCDEGPSPCVADGVATIELRDCVFTGLSKEGQVWMGKRRPLVACHGRNIVGVESAAGLDAVPAPEVLAATATMSRHIGRGDTSADGEAITNNQVFEYLACDQAGFEIGAPDTSDNSDQKSVVLRRRLKILGMEVKGLRKSDLWIFGGKADPYVVMDVAGKQRRTEKVRNVLSATWDKLGWEFEPGEGSSMSEVDKNSAAPDGAGFAKLEVWDYDFMRKDDILGTAVLPLSAIEPEEEQAQDFDVWLDLLDAGKLAEANWKQDAIGEFAARQWAAEQAEGLSPSSECDLEAAVVRVEASSEDDGCSAVRVLEKHSDGAWQSCGEGEGAWLSIQLCDFFLITSISFETLAQDFVAENEDSSAQGSSSIVIGSVAIECGGKTNRMACTDGGQCTVSFGEAGLSGDRILITVETIHPRARRNPKAFAIVLKSLSVRGRSAKGRLRVWGRMEVERTLNGTVSGMVDTSALLTNVRDASLGVVLSALQAMTLLAKNPANRLEIARKSAQSVMLVLRNFGESSPSLCSEAFKALAQLMQLQRNESGVNTKETSKRLPVTETLLKVVADAWEKSLPKSQQPSVKTAKPSGFVGISVLDVEALEENTVTVGSVATTVQVGTTAATVTNKSNAFCTITSKGSQVCTPDMALAGVAENARSFSKVMPFDSPSKICLTVWATDGGGEELVGETSLSISSIGDGDLAQWHDVWLDLNNPFKWGYRVCGRVRVRYRKESSFNAIAARNVAPDRSTSGLSSTIGSQAQLSRISEATICLLQLHGQQTTLGDSDVLAHGFELLQNMSEASAIACTSVCTSSGLLGLLTLAGRLSSISLPLTMQDKAHADFEASRAWRGLLNLNVDAEVETQPPIATAFSDVRVNVRADKRVGKGEEDLGFAYSAWGLSSSVVSKLDRSKARGFLDKEHLARYLVRLASPAAPVIHCLPKGSSRTGLTDGAGAAPSGYKARPMSGRRSNHSPETLEVSIVDGVLLGKSQVNACVVVTVAGVRARSPSIPHVTGKLEWKEPLLFRGSHLTGGELMVELMDDSSGSNVDTLIGYAQVPLVRPQINKQDRLQGISDWVQLQSVSDDGGEKPAAKIKVRQRWTSWMETSKDAVPKASGKDCCVLQDVKVPRGWSLGDFWEASQKADWPMRWRVKEGKKVEVRLSKAPTVEIPTDRLQQESGSLFVQKWTRTRFGSSEKEVAIDADDKSLLSILDERYKKSCGIEITENHITAPMHMVANTSKMYVVDGSVLKDGVLVLIEKEIVLVLQGGGGNVLSVARGQQKTKSALHQAGAAVIVLTDALPSDPDSVLEVQRNVVYTRGGPDQKQHGRQKRLVNQAEWNNLMAEMKAITSEVSEVNDSAWKLLEKYTTSRQLTARHMMDVVDLHDKWATRQSKADCAQLTDQVQASSRAWWIWKMERLLSRQVLASLSDIVRKARNDNEGCRLRWRVLECTSAAVTQGWVRGTLVSGSRVRETAWTPVEKVDRQDGWHRAVLNAEFEVPVAACIDMIPQSATVQLHARCGHAIVCTASVTLPIFSILSCPKSSSFKTPLLTKTSQLFQAVPVLEHNAMCGCQVSGRSECGPVRLALETGTAWHPPMIAWQGNICVEVAYDGMGVQELRGIWDEARSGVCHPEAEVRAVSAKLLLEATALTSARSRMDTLMVCRALLKDEDWRVVSQAVQVFQKLLQCDAPHAEGTAFALVGDLTTALEIAAKKNFPAPLLVEMTDTLGFSAQRGDMRVSCALVRTIWWQVFQRFIRDSDKSGMVIPRKWVHFRRIMSVASVTTDQELDQNRRKDPQRYFRISAGSFAVRSTLRTLHHQIETWQEHLALCVGKADDVVIEVWEVEENGRGRLVARGEFPALPKEGSTATEEEPTNVLLRDPDNGETVGKAIVNFSVSDDDTAFIRGEAEGAGLLCEESDKDVDNLIITKTSRSSPAGTSLENADSALPLLCALSKIAGEGDVCSSSAALACRNHPDPSVRSQVVSLVTALIPGGGSIAAFPLGFAESNQTDGSIDPSWQEQWSMMCALEKGKSLGRRALATDLWKEELVSIPSDSAPLNL